MKKRILTLLLAGLMAMSAVACNEPTENPNLTTDPTTTTAPVVDTDGYQIVNETVFSLVDELKLRAEANTAIEPAMTLGFATKFTRVKFTTRWSVVTYEGVEYYVESENLTTDDLGIETFSVMTETKMHVSREGGAYARKYPTTARIKGESANYEINVYKELVYHDNVTVVGQNSDWYQIMMDGQKLYVAKTHLAEGSMTSVADLGNYEAKFEAGKYQNAVPMYVDAPGSGAKVRIYPSTEEFSGTVTSLPHATRVTAIAIAKMIDGYSWIKVTVLEDPSDPQSSTVQGYIRGDLLSANPVADNSDLDSLVELYRLTEYPNNITKYVANNSGGLRLRYTPDETSDKYFGSLPANQKVTAVAYGTGEYEGWMLVEHSTTDADGNEKKSWYFVSSRYLVDNEGDSATLGANSYEDYPGFTAYAGTPTKTVTAETALFLTPDLKIENKKSTIAAGASVTVIAEGTSGAYSVYFIKDANGSYWFIDRYKVN